MAVELVRRVWCDIHLKKYKERVEAEESVATVIHEGRFIRVDACETCKTNLTFMEILTYGYHVDPPKADPAKMTRDRLGKGKRGRPRKEDKPEEIIRVSGRDMVECSLCGKQVTSGSGWGLHNNAHKRRGETSAEQIPVVA